MNEHIVKTIELEKLKKVLIGFLRPDSMDLFPGKRFAADHFFLYSFCFFRFVVDRGGPLIADSRDGPEKDHQL